MRFPSVGLRPVPGRTAVLVAGIAAAAATFTALAMNASALTVQLRGRVPATSPRRAYDILVRTPSRVARPDGGAAPVRPTDLSELTGGITLKQYDVIRQLPGVQVAAPMTMVGYVPLTVVIPIAVPSRAIASSPEMFAVTASLRSDHGLVSVTRTDVGTTYVAGGVLPTSVCPAAAPAGDGGPAAEELLTAAAAAYSAGAQPRTTCWSTTNGPELQGWAGPPPSTVSVPLAWTFLLPLVAVDPAAEASLLGLDRAVVQGLYLPSKTARSGPVPVIMASSIDDDSRLQVSLTQLPASAARSYVGGPAVADASELPGVAGQSLSTSSLTSAQAYAELLRYLRRSGSAPVEAYWTPSPARYVIGTDGALTPLPVASDGGFRALTLHIARSRVGTRETQSSSPLGAALRVVGAFDAARVTSSEATPSPYRGEQLTAADSRSLRLLGGGKLGPDGNPADYPSPGATLVMPLQDIGAFTAAGGYTGTDASAPIGSIRIRVTGATGDDALSRERVRLVAQEIVRATGLPIDVTLAGSATTRTVDLAEGGGRTVLRLHEVWYRSDTSTAVSSSVDPRSIALSAGVLLIGFAFAGSGVMATMRQRRREVATLRALGWGRRRVAWRLGREFVLIATAAGILATLAAYGLAATGRTHLATAWPLLSLPAAITMTLAAAGWQLRTVTADALMPAVKRSSRPASGPRQPTARATTRVITRLRQARWRTGLALLVIVVACAAFGLELAVRWLFGGVIVGSWLGFAVSWQVDTVDRTAVIVILMLATITMTDIGWRNGGERSAELRTLRAIGWPARGVARLAAGDALLLGLAGGVLASALDVAVIVAIVHRLSPSLALVAVAAIGLGVTLSLITVSLSAAVERAIGALA